MEIVALHTRLLPDAIEAYEDTHAVTPRDLDVAMRRAGVKVWRIWRDGLDLFHYLEVENIAAMRTALHSEPAEAQWQARVGPLIDASDGAPIGSVSLKLVWALKDPA